jgi:chorismate--pyruvate lyase
MHHREPVWRSSRRLLRTQVPAGWWEWLLDPASLTQRLQRACEGRFSVEVIRQCWDKPLHNEARAMGLLESRRALIREVYLHCDGRPWVFARTVIPHTTLTGRERRLMHLGNKPLGAVLFAEPRMQRGEVELACIHPGQRLFRVATQRQQQNPVEIWGRRSVFRLHDKPLLVSEIFLPGIPKHT